MRNVNQKLQERINGNMRRGALRSSEAPSEFTSPLLETFNVCGFAKTGCSNSLRASRHSALWWPWGRFKWLGIAAYAIVVLVVSISVCSMLAQAATKRKQSEPLHLTKAGKRWVAATLRSLTLEEKIGQMLMRREPQNISVYTSCWGHPDRTAPYVEGVWKRRITKC